MSNTVKNPILLKIKFKHDFHLLPILSRCSKMDCSAMYCHYWTAPGKTSTRRANYNSCFASTIVINQRDPLFDTEATWVPGYLINHLYQKTSLLEIVGLYCL